MASQELSRKRQSYEVTQSTLLKKPCWYYCQLDHDEPSCYGEMIMLFDQCSIEPPHCERCPVFRECQELCDKDWWTMRHRDSILQQLETFKEIKNQHIEIAVFQGISEWSSLLNHKLLIPPPPYPLPLEGEGEKVTEKE